jgi:hypothetical protein
LIHAPLGLVGAVAACRGDTPKEQKVDTPPAGAPPTFGATPEVGPEVSPATFAEAEKLMQVQMSDAERKMAAATWRKSMSALIERRTGPKKIALEATVSPGTQWNPVLPGQKAGPAKDVFVAI